MIEIELNDGYKVKIDEEDYDFVVSLKPFALKRVKNRFVYIMCHYKGAMFALARCLMNPPEGLVVTFIDGDRLNLQKENLLVCRRGKLIKAKYGTVKPLLTPQPSPPDVKVQTYKTPKPSRIKRNQAKATNIYKSKAVKEDTHRKYLVEDLVQEDRLEVKTLDTLADVFKDFKPDGWEPPRDP